MLEDFIINKKNCSQELGITRMLEKKVEKIEN